MTFGGFIVAIRSKISPKYLFYFLRLQFLNGKFMGSFTQTTNIANINSTALGETETPVPPLEEQQRIVYHIEALFAKLDEAKEKAQEVVDGFATRKTAILHKAFSSELTKKWRTEHCASQGSYEKIPLGELTEITSSKRIYKEEYVQTEIPFFRSSEVVELHDHGTTIPEYFIMLKRKTRTKRYLF